MSDARSAVRGGALSAGAMLGSMAAMLVVGKVFTNSLPQDKIDIFALVLVAADLLNAVNNFGLSSSLPKLLGGAPPAERPGLLRLLLRFQRSITLGLAAAMLIGWTLIGVVPQWITHPAWRGAFHFAWLLALLFVVGTFRDTLLAAYAGLNQFTRRASAQICGAVAHAVLVLYFVGFRDGGIATLGLCTFTAHALTVAILLLWLPRGAAPTEGALQLRDALVFSNPLHANSCLHFVFQRFDTLLITVLIATPGAVAIYEVIKRIPLMFSRTLGALLVPFLPTIARHAAAEDFEKASAFLARAYALVAFMGYAGALALVAIREPIILLLFSPEYLGGAAVLGILTVAICLTVQAGMMGQTLIALGQPKWVIRSNVGMAFVSIAANILLIPRYGIEGAAWSAVLAGAFSNVAQTFFVRRNGICIGVLAYLKPHCLLAGAATLLLLGDGYAYSAGALALFVVGAFLTRLVTPEMLRTVLTHLMPKRGDAP